MKLVKIFSMIALVMMTAACGSNPASTSTALSNLGVVPGVTVPGQTLLLGGNNILTQNSTITMTANVNANDVIYVNLANLSYGVADAECGASSWLPVHVSYPANGAAIPLTDVSVTLNGTPITTTTTATASGTVTLTATLDASQFHIRCTDLYANQVATPDEFFVNLGSAVSR